MATVENDGLCLPRQLGKCKIRNRRMSKFREFGVGNFTFKYNRDLPSPIKVCSRVAYILWSVAAQKSRKGEVAVLRWSSKHKKEGRKWQSGEQRQALHNGRRRVRTINEDVNNSNEAAYEIKESNSIEDGRNWGRVEGGQISHRIHSQAHRAIYDGILLNVWKINQDDKALEIGKKSQSLQKKMNLSSKSFDAILHCWGHSQSEFGAIITYYSEFQSTLGLMIGQPGAAGTGFIASGRRRTSVHSKLNDPSEHILLLHFLFWYGYYSVPELKNGMRCLIREIKLTKVIIICFVFPASTLAIYNVI